MDIMEIVEELKDVIKYLKAGLIKPEDVKLTVKQPTPPPDSE